MFYAPIMFLLLGDEGPTPGTVVSKIVQQYHSDIGSYSTFFLLPDGSVKVAGYYNGANYDIAIDVSFPEPVLDMIVTYPTEMSLQGDSVFFKTSSRLYALGENGKGQLGLGNTTKRLTPSLVGMGYTEVKSFKDRTYFYKDGIWEASGDNTNGLLLDGTTASSTSRVTCGLFGSYEYDILGGADEATYVVLFSGGGDPNIQSIGKNTYGQLGNGNTTDSLTSLQDVIGITRSMSPIVKTAKRSIYVETNTGVTYGFGFNFQGQLGIGNYTSAISTPTSIGDYVVYPSQTCALLQNGSILRRTGLVPALGSQVNTPTFARNSIAKPAISYSSTPSILLIKDDSTVEAIGKNTNGELGVNSFLDIFTWTSTGISSIIDVYTKGASTFFKTTGNTFLATGANERGQLSLGDIINKKIPTSISL